MLYDQDMNDQDPNIFTDPTRKPVAAKDVAEGSSMVGAFGDDRAVVVKKDGKVMAMSAICTHAGCTVATNDGDKTLDCPCHGSRFNLDGSVKEGPASKPLATIEVEEKDGWVVKK